ncbi:tRNA pseudouridine synthase 1 [Tilletia horrida]|uniref:tRNA pseudouridine synthase 1 n=1 Tax=Tilletia horrida TaxID=155126 RepID=A0AAN6GTD0_9BASI|nr:tRNA pseudouridine synthase 1 [Tilletia horrida]
MSSNGTENSASAPATDAAAASAVSSAPSTSLGQKRTADNSLLDREEARANGGGATGTDNVAATSTSEDPAHRSKRAKLDKNGNQAYNYRQEHIRGADFRSDRADYATEGRDESGKRLPKRKVAVFFGYCGIGYNGLQINPGVKTIEGDIFDAFCRVGAVSKDNAVNPAKVALQRSARTDRGVHAAGNVLTLKLIINAPGVASTLADVAAEEAAVKKEPGAPDETSPEVMTEPTATTSGTLTKSDSLGSLTSSEALVKAVNSILPPIIRIWGVTRVQGKFNARTSCDSRMYEYLLPTYVFLPPKPGTFMYGTLERLRDAGAGSAPPETIKTALGDGLPSWSDVLSHPFWAEHGTDKVFAEDMVAKKKWRIGADQLKRIRIIFHQYTGSHNFHNFTVGKEFRDRSAMRFMKELTISDPKLINGTEWVSVKLHGQSFMLHQIRKMIGLLVLIGRTPTPASLVAETYGPARIHIPKAPGLGLLLEQPLFGNYNHKIGFANKKAVALRAKKNKGKEPAETEAAGEDEEEDENMQVRDPVHFEPYKDEMAAFKQTYIYDRIMKVEEDTCEFGKWLNYLDVFTGPDFDYLSPKGSIPTHCILKVGDLRRPPVAQARNGDGTGAEAGEATGRDPKVAGGEADAAGESEDEEMDWGNAELEG